MTQSINKRDATVNECRNDLSSFCIANAHFIEAGGNIHMGSSFDLSKAVSERVDAIRKKLGDVTEIEVGELLKIGNIRFSPTPEIQSFCTQIQSRLLEKIAA